MAGIMLVTSSIFLSGCITFTPQSESAAQSAEIIAQQDFDTDSRQSLQAEAKRITQPPWPTGPRLRVSDFVLGDGITNTPNQTTVSLYLEQLESRSTQDNSALTILLQDAELQLRAATALRKIADDMSISSRLAPPDMSILEEAILSLRANKSVFVETLRALDEHGEPVTDNHIRSLRTAFTNAGQALGAKADTMSDRLAGDTTSNAPRNVATRRAPADQALPTPLPKINNLRTDFQ